MLNWEGGVVCWEADGYKGRFGVCIFLWGKHEC